MLSVESPPRAFHSRSAAHPEAPPTLGQSLGLTRPSPCWLLQIKEYEKLDSEEDRLIRSRQIYDTFIMKELLSCSHVSSGWPSQRSRAQREVRCLLPGPAWKAWSLRESLFGLGWLGPHGLGCCPDASLNKGAIGGGLRAPLLCSSCLKG